MTADRRRPLSQQERDGLFAMLTLAYNLRAVLIALKACGWQPPYEDWLRRWDDGSEVIRALATDTHSLVRETER